MVPRAFAISAEWKFPVADRSWFRDDLAISGISMDRTGRTEEERPKRGADIGKPHAPLRTWDVTDPTEPKILCTYQLEEQAQPYHGNDVRFGTHQLREIVDRDCMLYTAGVECL
jgi:hypothetical protein